MRLKEIAELAKQALALTARCWYCQCIDRKLAEVGVFRGKIYLISHNIAIIVLLLRPHRLIFAPLFVFVKVKLTATLVMAYKRVNSIIDIA